MRILANFDAEATWSGTPLGGNVRRRISALAPLLAVLAPPDRELEIWAPGEVAPGAIHWDAIGRSATLVTGTPPHVDLAWAAPAARAANDRRVAVAVQRELGLDHAHIVTTVAELVAITASLRGAWVAKAPWTAAGRDRIHGLPGDAPPRADQLTYARRLLERQGALVVEPWLERRFDTGVCAHLDAHGRVTAAPPHTLLSDARGAFGGIDLTEPPLSPAERAQLDRAVEASAAALTKLGYAGPFTVDAFAHTRGFHAPCEINARHSFGHITRALGARRLGFGPPPPGATVLVATADVTAWRA